MADPDPVKESLEEIKAAACDIDTITTGHTTSSELSQAELDRTDDKLNTIQNKITHLTGSGGDLEYPDPIPGTWTAIDTTGFNIANFGSNLCQEACDALDDYCDNNSEDAKRHLWRDEGLIQPFRDALGI